MTTAITPILNTDTHTISFWLKIRQGQDTHWRQIFAYRPPGTDRNPGIWLHPSPGAFGFHWKYSPGNTGLSHAGPTGDPSSFIVGTWYHIAGVKDGSSMTLYVNGVVSTSRSVDNPKTPGNAPVEIGQTAFVSGIFDIDEVRIYNRALSASEIAAIYAATK
jgi:hypothetical protein